MPTVVSKETSPKFCTGSTMRHVIVMASTASIGLMAIFVVDFANLFYISMLGQQELAAAIGYSGTLLFFLTSVAIGIMIGATAIVSRALGAGDRERARLLAGSSAIFMLVAMSAIAAMFFPFIPKAAAMLGAEGRTLEITIEFLRIVVPSVPLLGLGLAFSGILRATGDAKRAMYATLCTGVMTALLDPLLIFGLDLGVMGAAYSTAVSRVATIGLALYSIIKVHDMIALPPVSTILKDVRPLLVIAVPAVLANVATPVANAYVTSSVAMFGDQAVAGWAFIGRLIPLAFGLIFALSGAIGPIIGQNYGAGLYNRVRQAVIDSLTVTIVYTLIVWLLLFIARDYITASFRLTGEAAALVDFFINIVIVTFLFNGALFVANATFNNLGYATYPTLLNWGKATVGTIPFVAVGAMMGGAKGAVAGQGIGYIVFGVVGVFLCLRVINKIAAMKKSDLPVAEPAVTMNVMPDFASAKCAGMCMHQEKGEMEIRPTPVVKVA